MEKVVINTDAAPKAIGPYSQAVKIGSLLFVSGQIPFDPSNGQLVEGGIKTQTRRVLDNLSAVLEAAGATFANVVKTTVFLRDMNEFADMNEVYGEYFGRAGAGYPSRSTVQVARLPKDVSVEIEVIAGL